MPPQPVKIGRYELLDEIGRGGMGCVFRARDPILERVVAIKTLSVDLQAEPASRARFVRETRSAARLQHPNIVTVFEFGEQDGAPFIAMELLDGESLAEALRGGRLADLGRRLEVVVQLCEGLAFAHASGVVHRDVKPNNVMLLPGGRVKIVDFGVAWLEGSASTTRTGQLLGTPQYMAPEQFLGHPVDHRGDQWAVGVILWELLAGRRPFDAPTVPSLIYQVVHQPLPPAPESAPPALVEVAAKALAKRPEDRFANLEAMRDALLAARDQLPTARLAGTARLGSPPRVHDTSDCRLVATLHGHRTPVATVAARGSLVASGGRDGAVRVHHLDTRELVGGHHEHGRAVTEVIVLPDGHRLASVAGDGAVVVWDHRQPAHPVTLPGASGEGVISLAASGDGSFLLTATATGRFHLFSAQLQP